MDVVQHWTRFGRHSARISHLPPHRPPAMQASLDIDQAIRVVVAPSQASYFAGEPFVVTITISNLRTPQSSATPRSVSNSPYAHKRGAHSVSYVPMARPPTSPGIRTTLPTPSVRQSEETGAPTRRGVIGRGHPPQGAQVLPQPEQLKKRPVPNKSLSVSIAAHELRDEVLQDPKGKSPVRTLPAQTSLYACKSCIRSNRFFLIECE